MKTYVLKGSINGRSVRRKIARTNVLDLDAARKRAKDLMLAFHGGTDPHAKRQESVTLRQALDAYLTARKDLRERTRQEYRSSMARLASWLDNPLCSITREMVESRHADIAADIAQNGQHSGHASANGAMRALRAVWNFAADRDAQLPRNPVRLKKQWHPVHARTRHVNGDAMPVFYQGVMELESTVGRDYILLLLFTGLRRREAASLQWADVDFTNRIIRLAGVKTKSGRKLDLPMTDLLHDLLVARRSVGSAFVFPANSKSGHVEEPRTFFDEIAEATGIRVSCHDMRRTFLSVAATCKLGSFVMQALVNHSVGGSVTADYVQMDVADLREPAQKICDKIKRLCAIEEVSGANVARMR